jgi:chemotaxis protein CheX
MNATSLPTITPARIASAVTEAAQDVFSTMLGLPLQSEPSHQEGSDPSASLDGVIALVGIAGTWTGTGRIFCSPNFACKLAGGLLAAEYPAVDADVLDAVAEVANMIIGNAKTSFERDLGTLGLSVPTVIYGHNYQARCSSVQEWTVIPFRCGDDSMEIRFSLVPTPVMRPSHRTESVLA